MKDRPITKMLLCNSTQITCLKEDACFEDKDEKTHALMKLFIQHGYKGIVLKSRHARPIACFVRGSKHPTGAPPLVCFFGTEANSNDPDYDLPTSNCLATTGMTMLAKDSPKFIGTRLPPRTNVKGFGHIHYEKNYEIRGATPKAAFNLMESYDITSAEQLELFMSTQASAMGQQVGFQFGVMPLVTKYMCDVDSTCTAKAST